MDPVLMPQVPVNPPKFPTLKILQYTVLIGAILYFGRQLFIPLSFALLISFILYPVCHWLEQHKFNRPAAIFVSIMLLVILTACLVFLLVEQLLSFTSEWPALKEKLSQAAADLSVFLNEQLHISEEDQLAWLKNMKSGSSSDALSFITNTIYSSGVWVVLAILIPIFSALLLYYRSMLVSVLYSVFPDYKKPVLEKILHLTVTTYYNFIKGMAIVYLIVGILNSIGLLIIGVPHPFLFGFIASVLTCIPYIGIIVASLFPITLSWLTYNSIWYPIAVIALFTFVQYLEANLIFPLAVSNRLKINTFVTIIMIILGGIIWGAAGMILFIPFIAIVKLIADNTDELKVISTLLGTKNR